MEKELKEVKEVVMNRVPPGDRWVFSGSPSSSKVYQTLTDALEAYFQSFGNTKYYIDARKGTVSIVKEETVEKPVQKFSIYGED